MCCFSILRPRADKVRVYLYAGEYLYVCVSNFMYLYVWSCLMPGKVVGLLSGRRSLEIAMVPWPMGCPDGVPWKQRDSGMGGL